MCSIQPGEVFGMSEGNRTVDIYISHIYNINMRYEWDDNKNIINQKIHDGISFEIHIRKKSHQRRNGGILP